MNSSLFDPTTSLSTVQGDLFLNLLNTRHAKRAFLSQVPPPSTPLIQKILRTAANGTPSTKNTQPVGVTVVKDPVLSVLREYLLQQFDNDVLSKSEYHNRPENPTLEHFDVRIANYGRELFAFKGIDRASAEDRRAHERENYTFFGAPLLLLLHIPERAVAGTFLDAGLFLQSLLLSFHAYGYGCCPQYSMTRMVDHFRKFHEIYDKGLKPLLPEGRILVCGISIGVVDPDARINSFAPSRVALHEWVEFCEEPKEDQKEDKQE